MASAEHAPTLPPLTIARVAQLLDARGSVYGTDTDGDLVGRWDGHAFWFITIGRRQRVLPGARPVVAAIPGTEFGNVLLAANAWSESMVWPKLYVRIEYEQVAVYTEHTVGLRVRRDGRAAGPAPDHRDRQRAAVLRRARQRYPDAVPPRHATRACRGRVPRPRAADVVD